MSDSLVSSAWAPVLIGKEITVDSQCLDAHRFEGYTFSGLYVDSTSFHSPESDAFSRMYGATLGQSIVYTHWFPDDPWIIKALVWTFTVFFTTYLTCFT